MESRYIVVEGPIGVGKSTLTGLIAERFGGRQVLEEVEENPFLADFYADRERYAFQTQTFFLLSRFRQQEALLQRDLFRAVTVSDYLFAKDRIFACLTLQQTELSLYDRVYDALTPRVPKPDLVVYLTARLDVLLKRIRIRGRPFEDGFDRDYLQSLSHAYTDFFGHYADTPLLIVDTSNLDFVSNPEHQERILEAVKTTRSGKRELRAPAPSEG